MSLLKLNLTGRPSLNPESKILQRAFGWEVWEKNLKVPLDFCRRQKGVFHSQGPPKKVNVDETFNYWGFSAPPRWGRRKQYHREKKFIQLIEL